MEYSILLDTSSNRRQIEEDEQLKFVVSTLDSMEVPIDFDPSEEFTTENKLKLKKICKEYGISVINDGGETKVYLEGNLISHWKKSLFVFKQDLNEMDPKKRLYVEMRCSFWSMYESEDESNTNQ